jgi:ABC-type Fe3+-siderophore transport system permease subunit
MDFNSILSAAKEHLLPHWPFLVAAFLLGTVGQFAKNRIWTKERAAKSKIVWWIRAALPLHAPLAGALLALAGVLIFKEVPASLGAKSIPAVMLYYAGAGGAAAWFMALVKHFMKSRGIQLAPVSMPPKPNGGDDGKEEEPPDTERNDGTSDGDKPPVA